MHHFVRVIGPIGRRARGEALKKSHADRELWLQRAHSTVAETAHAPRPWSRLDFPSRARPP